MSFSFGFRFDDTAQPVGSSGQESALLAQAETSPSPQLSRPVGRTTAQREAVGSGSRDDVEERRSSRSGARLPFSWILPSQLTEICRKKRREGLSSKEVALEPSPSSSASSSLLPCACDSGTGDRTRVVADGTRRVTTLPLRRVLLRGESEPGGSRSDNNNQRRSGGGRWDDLGESVIQRGVYEGGGVVWECSVDLISYLMENGSEDDGSGCNGSPSDHYSHQQDQHRFVLELGCGHALPSCYLLQQALRRSLAGVKDPMQRHDGTASSASTKIQRGLDTTLVLVDYNRSVVESRTIPNLILNASSIILPDEGADADGAAARVLDVEALVCENIVVGAGDWMDMSKQLRNTIHDKSSCNEQSSSLSPWRLPPDGKFHVIVASETLYTREAARETAELVMRHLHATRGVAYVASKRYYFGVGGGVDDFRSAVDATRFRAETVRVVDTGVGNIREILKVTRLCVR